ncbi:hypothetical protein [Thiolapillus sp.]|uniref:hypothetical protein n=1 Tax=Thiolapillus sp. TaxID=2017437 RepID=UPI0025E592C2|nr:hypothetical protein [Thiolapillus sp.]
MTRTAGAPIGCQRPSRFWGLGCPKIYHEVEDTLENIGHITPIQALKDWHKKQPELFKKKIYDLSGLYMYR